MVEVILFSKTVVDHLKTIKTVMIKLAEAGLKLKIRKCSFFADEIKFLGYTINKDGMFMCSGRVKANKEMSLLISKRQLQSFLGSVHYFRMFIPNFTESAEPLCRLLSKGVTFNWTSAQTEAINSLKGKLSNSPILKFLDCTLPFHLFTDVSNVGIGAVLLQVHD